MALKRCPECKKKISDTCDTCVHCGYKLKHGIDEEFGEMTDMGSLPKDNPLESVFKIFGMIFGSILAVAAIALLIYTFINIEQLGFSKGAIMEASAVISLLVGGTAAILCNRLL